MRGEPFELETDSPWPVSGFAYSRQPPAANQPGYVRLTLPLWVPAGLTAAMPCWWLIRRPWRRLPGLCTRCGYNLTGNVSGVCPECGTDRGAAT